MIDHTFIITFVVLVKLFAFAILHVMYGHANKAICRIADV